RCARSPKRSKPTARARSSVAASCPTTSPETGGVPPMLNQALLRRGLAAALAIPLAGCLSFGAEPPEQLLTLTPDRAAPAGAAAAGEVSSALAVLEPDAQQRLNVTRVPVQVSD